MFFVVMPPSNQNNTFTTQANQNNTFTICRATDVHFFCLSLHITLRLCRIPVTSSKEINK